MRQTGIPIDVAIDRMWIYAHHLETSERVTMEYRVRTGHTVTYIAYDSCGEDIGGTRLEPESSPPVATVTETTF